MKCGDSEENFGRYSTVDISCEIQTGTFRKHVRRITVRAKFVFIFFGRLQTYLHIWRVTISNVTTAWNCEVLL